MIIAVCVVNLKERKELPQQGEPGGWGCPGPKTDHVIIVYMCNIDIYKLKYFYVVTKLKATIYLCFTRKVLSKPKKFIFPHNYDMQNVTDVLLAMIN